MDENNNNQNSWEQQPQQTQWEQQPQQTQWEQQPEQTKWQQGMPPYQQNNSLSVGAWLLTLIIMAVPCVGLIMLFIWAFGDEEDPRRNFARASLILALIGFVLSFLFAGVIMTTLASMKIGYM